MDETMQTYATIYIVSILLKDDIFVGREKMKTKHPEAI